MSKSNDKPKRNYKAKDSDKEKLPYQKKEPYKGTRTYNFNKKEKVQKKTFADDGIVRLNRFLANAGICSRREADNIISTGVVKINGKVVSELGTKVNPGDIVHYGGELISGEKKQYVLLNKPKDFITTMDDPQNRRTVMELVQKACKERIYPVGRLDRATSGLLLFTNDGQLTKRLTHPSGKVKKIYQIGLDKNVTQNHIIQLVEGVELDDGIATADKVYYANDGIDKSHLVIELHSGRNRIIRRMMETLGYKVTKLDRTHFAGLTKKNIIRGRFRHLSEKEIGLLHRVAGISSKQ